MIRYSSGTSLLYNSEIVFEKFRLFLDSIVVSISACHADDPGSIPGRGGLINFWGMKATEMALFTKNWLSVRSRRGDMV